MDTHHDEQLPERAQNTAADHRHHIVQRVDTGSQSIGNACHDRADHQQGERQRDDQHRSRHEHQLQHLRDDLFRSLFDPACHKDGQQDGQQGLGVIQHRDLEAEEGKRFLRAHESSQLRVQHRCADDSSGIRIHAKDLAGRETDDDGHKVHQRIGRCIQDQVNAVVTGEHTEGGQDGQKALDDTTGGHGCDHGQDAAGNGLEELVEEAVLLDHTHAFGLGLAGSHGILRQAQLCLDDGAQVRDISTDGDLVLSCTVHNAHHAFDFFDLVILDDALVCQHKAQTGHAVRHTDNVLFAADCRDQLIGKLIVVFSCHDLVLFLFDIFQNTHKNLTQLAFHCMLVSKSYLYCTVSGTVSQSQKQTPVLTKSNFSSNDTGKV